MHPSPPPLRASSRELAALCLPLLVWVGVVLLAAQKPALTSQASAAASQQEQHAATHAPAHLPTRRGRVLLIILDSLRLESVRDHMPTLEAMRTASPDASRPVRTCSANFTLVCVQTILEGRLSPFVASIHNFTGAKGSAKSLPNAFEQAGLSQRMLSDYTLDSLYGHLAQESLNVEEWQEGSHLEHDLRAIRIATEWLEQRETDVVLLHLIGTDKAAHLLRPDHPDYADHFARVDTALQTLYDTLDPETDHLLIAGDHGHDQKGHHTRDSLLIVKSPLLSSILSLTPAEEPLDQPELAYLLAVASGAPLHLDYEGRYFGLDQRDAPLPPQLAPFAASQREALRAAGYTGEELPDLLAQRDADHRAKPFLALAKNAPLLLLYLSWLLVLVTSWRARSPDLSSPTRHTLSFCLAGAIAGLSSLYLPASLNAAIAAALIAALIIGARRGPLRHERSLIATLCLMLIAAAIIAVAGPEWRNILHNYGELRIQTPLFFVGLVALGALLSKLYSRSSWSSALPLTVGGLCFWALPSGIYYYQFGQNITRGVLLGLLVALICAAVKARGALPALARELVKERVILARAACFLLAAGLVLWQKSASWIWHSRLVFWLDRSPEWAAPLCFITLSALLLWCTRGLRWRLFGVVLLGFIAAYSVWIAQTSWAQASSVIAVMLLGSSSLALKDDLMERFVALRNELPPSYLDELTGLWCAALMLMGAWTLLQGFFIESVDFNFAFEFTRAYKHESQVALIASTMTYFKYAPFLWLLSLGLMGRLHTDWRRAARMLLWAIHFKMLALMVQIFFGALDASEKLFELALSDLLFVFGILLHFLTGMLLVTVYEKASRAPDPGRPASAP